MQENSVRPRSMKGANRSSGPTSADARGRTRSQIAEEVGLSYTAVSKTIERYETQGMAALAPRTRGRRSGEERALTPEQEERVRLRQTAKAIEDGLCIVEPGGGDATH